MTNATYTIDEFVNIFEEAYNIGIDGVDTIKWSISWSGEKRDEIKRKVDSMFERNQFTKQWYPVDNFIYAMRRAMEAALHTDGLVRVEWNLDYIGRLSAVSEVVSKMERMNREIGLEIIDRYVNVNI